jgi:hypothetical protein
MGDRLLDYAVYPPECKVVQCRVSTIVKQDNICSRKTRHNVLIVTPIYSTRQLKEPRNLNNHYLIFQSHMAYRL